MNSPGLKTGFFILSGVICFTFVGMLLAKLDLFSDRTPFIVRFSVQEGVMGLAAGSDVQIGGLSRGRVERVQPVLGAQGEFTALDVHIAIDRTVKVHKDAEVMRLMPLLGTAGTLNFVSLGEEGEPLPAGSILDASVSGGILATLLGPTNAVKADEMVENALQFSAFLAQVPGDYQKSILPILDNAGAVVGLIRTDYSDWRTKIGASLTSAQASMLKLDGSLTDVQGLVVRNAPTIDATLANLDIAMGSAKDALIHVNQETIPLIDSALRRGESLVDDFVKSVDIVHTLLLERSADIAESISNIRTASGQLKLASIEIRRSPWKILYQPNSDQIAHENLYESARSFAMAAGDLRAAGDALRIVIERDPGKYETDSKFRESLQAMVLDAVAKYDIAQKQLNSVLMAPEPAGESKAK
ncbi:MAG: hypothetical protein EXS15_07155 [Phycisphaerales bacterium]|nr:hypothetical protein [Phycisphaerales bacterium]